MQVAIESINRKIDDLSAFISARQEKLAADLKYFEEQKTIISDAEEELSQLRSAVALIERSEEKNAA